VAALSLTSFIILGSTLATIGIFLVPLGRSFGWTQEELARLPTVFLIAMTLFGPVIGWLLERVRPQFLMSGGALLVAMSYYLAGQSSNLTTLSLAMAAAGAGVCASTNVASVVVIAGWIRHRLALAIAITVATSALGGALFQPLTQYFIQTQGWRSALQWIACAIFLVAVPVLLFSIRAAPGAGRSAPFGEASPRSKADLAPLILSSSYALIVLMSVLSAIGYMGVYFHFVPFLVAAGVAASQAAAAYAGLSVMSFFGYLLIGVCADRFGPKWTLMFCLTVSALSTVLLLSVNAQTSKSWTLPVFVVLWGVVGGGSFQLAPVLLTKTSGMRHFGVLVGIVTLLCGVASAMGPLLTGVVHDRMQGYSTAFAVCALLTAAALIPAGFIRGKRIA